MSEIVRGDNEINDNLIKKTGVLNLCISGGVAVIREWCFINIKGIKKFL